MMMEGSDGELSALKSCLVSSHNTNFP